MVTETLRGSFDLRLLFGWVNSIIKEMKVLNSYIIEINCKQMYPQDQARNVHRSEKTQRRSMT